MTRILGDLVLAVVKKLGWGSQKRIGRDVGKAETNRKGFLQ